MSAFAAKRTFKDAMSGCFCCGARPWPAILSPRSLALGKPRAAHDIENENPFLDYVIAPFCRSVSGSGVHLSGIRKNAGSLEARLRIWNIPVYLCRGAARRRGSLSGEDGFPAMPRQLNGYTSYPLPRSFCQASPCSSSPWPRFVHPLGALQFFRGFPHSYLSSLCRLSELHAMRIDLFLHQQCLDTTGSQSQSCCVSQTITSASPAKKKKKRGPAPSSCDLMFALRSD